MRYLKVIALILIGVFSAAIFSVPNARAAGAAGESAALGAPAPTQDQIAATAASLTQQSPGTWTTTAYVDTGALCPVPVSFDLVTTKPYSDTADTSPRYVGGLQCGAVAAHPVTEVALTFTPSPALSAIPQTASLALTPSPAELAVGVIPVDLTLPVRRAVSAAQYVWIPVICGLLLAAALVGLTTMFGVSRPGGGKTHMHRSRFWRMPLYASSAWTFGDSWATNITAVGTVVGAVLTASGSVAEVMPGIELGRFAMLIAFAGGITVVAPLLFGLLNYRFRTLDPTAAGVAVVSLPTAAANDRGVKIAVPASGSVTLFGAAIALPGGAAPNPGTSLDIPAGAVITVSAPSRADNADNPSGVDNADQPVLALPGTGDIVVTSGQLISVSIPSALAAGDPASVGSGAGQVKTIQVAEGAKISFLGRATLTLPAGARIQSPVAEPDHPPRDSVLTSAREFAIPRSAEVVAAQMWTMLAASCLTVFGIGAEIGIVGWVLGYDLVVAPQYVRDCSLAIAIAAVLLVLGYGVTAIRALADSREGTALSGPRGSSFML